MTFAYFVAQSKRNTFKISAGNVVGYQVTKCPTSDLCRPRPRFHNHLPLFKLSALAPCDRSRSCTTFHSSFIISMYPTYLVENPRNFPVLCAFGRNCAFASEKPAFLGGLWLLICGAIETLTYRSPLQMMMHLAVCCLTDGRHSKIQNRPTCYLRRADTLHNCLLHVLL